MASLSAGAASTVITPAVGSYMLGWGLRRGRSTGVHDDLRVRALVLDDGDERLAMVAMDVCYILAPVAADIRSRVKALTGIKEANVMLSASHTHTSPMLGGDISIWSAQGESQYMRTFPEYVAGTVAAANQLLQPALVSASSGELTGITVNRRHPDEPADTRLNVLRVTGTSGKNIAHVINFACHPVIVGGEVLTWSADFPGAACSFVEKATGGTCLFVNGAAGDVHPWDLWFENFNAKHEQTIEEAQTFGRVLGAEAVRLAETPSKRARPVKLRSANRKLTLKKRPIPSEAEAQKILDSIKRRYKPWTKDVWDPGTKISNIYRTYPDQYLISNAERLVAIAKQRNEPISAEMQGFGLGDIAIVSAPGELFSDLAIQAREKSRARETFIVSYTNGEIGYLPTVEAITECEDLSFEDAVGPRYTYGAALPVTQVSKESVRKISSTIVELANRVVT